MNPPQNVGSDWVPIGEKPNLLAAQKNGVFSLRRTGHTTPSNRIRFGQPPTPSEKTFPLQQDKPIGTNFSEVVRVMPTTFQQDTFLDDDVGNTVRNIKENFGDAPLIKAYEAALDISKESNKKWKEYWEEEARLQSLFEED
jgi:hypothetical protein